LTDAGERLIAIFNEAATMFSISFSHFFRQWRAYDEQLCRLARMNDRQLAAVGIDRLEIPRLAWQRAESVG
jgi:uncharacterized protein YjiS (DUF1127 family)